MTPIPVQFRRRWACPLVYTLVFLAAAALVFYPMWSQGLSFIYYYAGEEKDGFTQHYTAFVYIGRYIREYVAGLLQGQLMPRQFDFTLGYGEDVIQSLSFYGFGDPLMLLSALVPPDLVSSFYQVYVLLELWLAGLTFRLFGREMGYEDRWILPASLVYVFSGFALWAGLCHPEFLVPMIYFPLMLVGIERALQGRRPVFLAVSTALYALTGYYWLYMGTIFTCLYALVRFWHSSAGQRLRARLLGLWKFFLRAAGGYLLGILVSCPIFLPALAGFFQSNRVGGDRALPALLLTGTERLLYFLQLLSVSSWNFVALAAVVLPALLLLITRRERAFRGMQVMALLLAVFYLVPLFGYLFNAGAYASARWNVFLDFFAAYFVLMTLPALTTLTRGAVLSWAAALILYGWAGWSAPAPRRLYAIALIALAVTVAALAAAALVRRRRSGPGWERAMCGVLTLVVAGNAALNGTLALGDGGSSYRDMFAPAGLVDREVASMPAQLALDLEREEWQRLDQDYANNPNASMILDYAGVSSYFSTSNGTTARFLSDLELPLHNKVLFPDLDSRTFLDALLSTRYWAGAESGGRSVPYGFEQILTENGTGVWEDGSVLPLGYTYDTVISQEAWDGLNGLEKQEMMMQAVTAEGLSSTGQPPQTTVTQVEILSVTGQGADWSGGELNAWEGGSTLTITFQGLPDSETYLRLNGAQLAWTDASQYPVVVQAGDMTHTCTFTSQNFLWHSGQSSTSINLGYSQEGLTQVTLTFPEAGGFRMEDLEIWCQPMGSYDQWRDDLARESLTDIQVETDRITGSLSTSGPQVLCFAIPYSPGWSVYVDGEQVPTLKANDFLLAVEVDGGEHQVELRYHSPGFRLGLVLAGAGLAGIALLVLRNRRDRQHSTQREANTDG